MPRHIKEEQLRLEAEILMHKAEMTEDPLKRELLLAQSTLTSLRRKEMLDHLH